MSGDNDELITHQAIFDKLVILEQRSIARDDALGAIETKLVSLTELMEAWSALRTGGKFVKWLAGIVAAIGVIVVAVKHGFAQ